MIRTVQEIQKTTVEKKVVCSDFSGMEMPREHWSAVIRAELTFSDAAGNKTGKGLDLLPEEMRDFREGIDDLIASLRRKYQVRNLK